MVCVEAEDFQINLEILNDSETLSESNDFALWITLPLAMREGRGLRIEGPVSPKALENAAQISELWSFWLPELFEPLKPTTSEAVQAAPAPQGAPRLMCYSGGLDSTFALVRHVKEAGNKPALLTILGMDYRATDNERFTRLMAKTEPTRSVYSVETVNIRSNAASVMRRFDVKPDVGFAFNAFACLFLLQNRYQGGVIGADNPLHYEFARTPYGTNSISNPLFNNGNFSIDTLGLDTPRALKARYVAQFSEAVKTLTFCKDYGIRPENCGLCSKCLRTKAIFYCETGDVPQIFLDNSFDPSNVSMFDPASPEFHVVAVDILASARRNGRAGEFAALRDLIVRRPKVKRWRRLIMKAKAARQARKLRAGRG